MQNDFSQIQRLSLCWYDGLVHHLRKSNPFCCIAAMTVSICVSSKVDHTSMMLPETVLTIAEDGIDEFLGLFQHHISEILQDSDDELESPRPRYHKNWTCLDSTDLCTLRDFLHYNSKQCPDFRRLLPKDGQAQEIKETVMILLEGIRKSHWVAAGMLVVAFVLERVESISTNARQCAHLWAEMFKLAKSLREIKPLQNLGQRMVQAVEESVHLLVVAVIMVASQRDDYWPCKYVNEQVTKESLETMRDELEKSNRRIVREFIICQAQKSLTRRQITNGGPVGIDRSVAEIIEMMEFENDQKHLVAVIVHGAGGSGKTTVADAVYSSIKAKNSRHARICLFENGERKPHIPKLQISIVERIDEGDDSDEDEDEDDLDSEYDRQISASEGQSLLLERLQQHRCFIYIDNVLDARKLELLLPNDLSSCKSLRLLITARDRNVVHVLGIPDLQDMKLFKMPALEREVAEKLLIAEMGNQNLIDPQEMDCFAEICRGSPLAVKMVGRFMANEKDKARAWNIIKEMQNVAAESWDSGDFLCFAFDGLEEKYREPFLDICCFFHGHQWSYVGNIFGEEIMQVLENRGLIKKECCNNHKALSASEFSEEKLKLRVDDAMLQAARRVGKRDGTRITAIQQFKTLVYADKFNQDFLGNIKGIFLQKVEEELGEEHKEEILVLSAEILDMMSRSLRIFCTAFIDLQRSIYFDVITINGKCKTQFQNLIFLEIPNLDPPFNLRGSPQLSVLNFRPAAPVDLSQLPGSVRALSINSANLSEQIVEPIKISATDSSSMGLLPDLQTLMIQNGLCPELPQGFFPLLKSLRILSVIEFPNLRELPDDLHELPGLQVVEISNCDQLRGLPQKFGRCPSLRLLSLSNCPQMEKLPQQKHKLGSGSIKLQTVDCDNFQQKLIGALVSEDFLRNGSTPVQVS